MRIAIFLVGILLAGHAGAVEFYCGDTIVKQGDSMETVRAECGDPASIVENAWYYLQGPGQLVKVVYFGGGKVEYVDEQQPSAKADQGQAAEQEQL